MAESSQAKRLKTDSGSPVSATRFQRCDRSDVWKFFDKAKKDGRSVAICNLCERVLVYNGSTTSNLRDHLSRKHPVGERAVSAKQGTLDAHLTANPEVAKVCSVHRQDKITALLAKWTWRNLRPVSIVEDAGLCEVLAFVEPGYRPPSHTHVSSLIKKRFADGVARLRDLLGHQSALALTSDAWTSRATQAFATTTAHFIDEDWKMRSACLDTSHFPGSHTGERIAEKLLETTEAFDIENRRVVACVHDQAANAGSAGTILHEECGWETVTCSAHRLQNAIKTGLTDSSRTLEKLLAKARKFVCHFKHSALATNALLEKQRQISPTLKPRKLIQDVATRWNSVYVMIWRLVELRVPVSVVLSEDAKCSGLDLSGEEWCIAQSLIAVLRDLEGMTKRFSGETYTTMSWVLPLIFGMIEKSLVSLPEDLAPVAKVKDKLKSEIKRPFSPCEAQPVILRSPCLCPRPTIPWSALLSQKHNVQQFITL